MAERSYFIRQKTYRGVEGYSIGSRGGGGWHTRIHVHTREGAIMIVKALKAKDQGKISQRQYEDIEGKAFAIR